MNDQSMKFRLGVFVLGAAILLAILIVLFAQFPAIFGSQIDYQVTLTEAAGIEPGTPVRKSGVRIGEVTSVDLQADTGEVVVHIVVEKKYQLRKGDQAQLVRGLVLGDTTINFAPQGQDREPAPADYTFKGKPAGDLSQVIGKATTDLLPATRAALEEIQKLTKTVNEAFPDVRRTNSEIQVAASNLSKAAEGVDNIIRGNQDKINKAIENFVEVANRAANVLNDENQKNLAGTLQNIRTASNRLESVMKEGELLVQESQKTVKQIGERVESTSKGAEEWMAETRKAVKTVADRVDSVGKSAEELITEARRTAKTVNDRVDSAGKNADDLMKEGRVTMQRINSTLTRTDEVIANLQTATRPLAEKAPTVMKNLEDSSARINQITFNIAEFTKALNQGDGTLRRLLNDPSLYNNVNNAACGLSKSVCRIETILRDLEVFADKVARHPELLGVSGAVSPSGGIKR